MRLRKAKWLTSEYIACTDLIESQIKVSAHALSNTLYNLDKSEQGVVDVPNGFVYYYPIVTEVRNPWTRVKEPYSYLSRLCLIPQLEIINHQPISIQSALLWAHPLSPVTSWPLMYLIHFILTESKWSGYHLSSFNKQKMEGTRSEETCPGSDSKKSDKSGIPAQAWPQTQALPWMAGPRSWVALEGTLTTSHSCPEPLATEIFN